MPLSKTSAHGAHATHGLASLESALASNGLANCRVASVVVLCVESLPEVRTLFGTDLYHAALGEIQLALTRTIRGHGIGARTGPTEFTLVFPELYKREAGALLSVSLGKPLHFEVSLGESEVFVAPEFAVDGIKSGETLREAHGRLRKQVMRSIAMERERLEAMTRHREHYARRAMTA